MASQNPQPVLDLFLIIRRELEQLEPFVPIMGASYHGDQAVFVITESGGDVLSGHRWEQEP
jgi:hypothetical protein